MNKLNYNETGTLITDEVIYGSTTTQKLAHDNFFNLEIWTGKGKTGTQLVEGTDYTLGDYDASYQAYNSITFDAAYDGVKLYATYYTKGDYVDAEDVNALQGAGYFKGSKETDFYGVNILTINNDSAPCETEYEIYPITIVNLLGKYGNFEVDSNSDGIADGWEKDGNESNDLYNLTSGISGNGQLLHKDSSGSLATFFIRRYVEVSTTHIYFVRSAAKITNYVDSDIYVWAFSLVKNFDTSLINQWQVLYTIATPNNEPDNISLIIKKPTSSYNEAIFDMTAVYDLTEMGELPPPLKEFFQSQVTNWEDLATTSNITAIDGRTQTGEDWLAELLPYCDSVATIGYSFSDGQLNVEIINRGNNLWHRTSYDVAIGTPYYFKADSQTSFYLELGPKTSDVWYGIQFYFPGKPGKTYRFSCKIKFLNYIQGKLGVALGNRLSPHNVVTWVTEDTTFTRTFSGSIYDLSIKFFKGYWGEFFVYIYDISLTEEGSSASEYTPPRESKIEFATPLFNVRGTTDVLKTNGLLVKRTGYREILGIDSDWLVTSVGTVNHDDGSIWAYIRFDTYYINPSKNVEQLLFNYNGEYVKLNTSTTDVPGYITYATSTTSGERSTFIIKVKLGTDSIAGWEESYTPTEDDWKRFFNGWKYSDGTTWNGIGSSTATANATTSLTSTVLDVDSDANWHPIIVIYQQGYKEDVDPTNGPFMGEPMEEHVPVDITGNLVLYNDTNYILAPQMALKISKGRKLEYNDVVDKNFTT